MTTLYTTGQKLKQLVLSKAGDDAVSPDFGDEVETYLQTAYIGFLGMFGWTFGRKSPPGVLNTVAEITTGTVTLTNGSTAGTFSSAPAVSVAGRKIFTDTEAIVCRIATHTAGQTAFTLDAAYPGQGGSGLSYTVFQDEYSLANDFLRPANEKRFLRDCHGSYDMDLISPTEMDALYPYSATSSTKARYCAVIRDKTLRLSYWPTDVRRYEYEYIYHPGTLTFDGGAGDTLIIQPAEDRIVVAYVAAAELMVDMNDDRFAALAEKVPTAIDRMKRNDLAKRKGRLFMRRQFAVGSHR